MQVVFVVWAVAHLAKLNTEIAVLRRDILVPSTSDQLCHIMYDIALLLAGPSPGKWRHQ